MSDMQKTTSSLSILCVFVDEDTRSITLKDPKASITSAEITTLNNFMQRNNIIVGDKEAATFGRIKTVTRVTKNEYQLDLET